MHRVTYGLDYARLTSGCHAGGANGGRPDASAESAFDSTGRGNAEGSAVAGGAGGYINPSAPRPGASVNPTQSPDAMARAGESQQAQQAQRSASHVAMNGSAVATGAPGQLTEFGIPENSAVLAPIALQEDEPVRAPDHLAHTASASRYTSACYRFFLWQRLSDSISQAHAIHPATSFSMYSYTPVATSSAWPTYIGMLFPTLHATCSCSRATEPCYEASNTVVCSVTGAPGLPEQHGFQHVSGGLPCVPGTICRFFVPAPVGPTEHGALACSRVPGRRCMSFSTPTLRAS